MTAESTGDGLHIDMDWKTEAAREKERLARKEQQAQPAADRKGADAPPNFLELINLLAMQAAIGLGGLQTPEGQRIPANPVTAKHFIDLLETLKEKTQGNLNDDEKRSLDAVLFELQQQYVHAVTSAKVPPEQSKP